MSLNMAMERDPVWLTSACVRSSFGAGRQGGRAAGQAQQPGCHLSRLLRGPGLCGASGNGKLSAGWQGSPSTCAEKRPLSIFEG